MADQTNNDKITQGLEESWAYASPGDIGLAQIKESEAYIKNQESAAQAEVEWKRSGVNQFVNALYDHKQAYQEGNVDFTKALPNKFYKPRTMQIAGRDFITGHNSFGPRSAVLDEGVEILRNSSFIPGKPLPIEDIGGLTKIAESYARNGQSFDEFRKNVPLSYDVPHMKAAWGAGLDALGMRNMENKFRRLNLAWNAPASIEFPELMASKEWAQHGRTVYRFYNAKDFAGTDIEASQWLASHWRNFDLNTPAAAATIANAVRGSPELINAYGKSLELWNVTAMEKSFKAQLGNVVRMALDPVNLLGAGVGKLTVMTAGRKALMDVLKRVGYGSALGGAMGAGHAAGTAAITGQEQDPGKIAAGAAGGAVAVGGLFGAVPEALAVAGAARNYIGKANAALEKANPLKGTVLDPGGSLMAKAVPASSPAITPHDPATGFYSPVLRQIETMKMEKGTPEQMIAEVRKGKGVSLAEREFLDLENAFKGQKTVTRADLLEHVNAVGLRMEETRLGEPMKPTPDFLQGLRAYWDEFQERMATYRAAGGAGGDVRHFHDAEEGLFNMRDYIHGGGFERPSYDLNDYNMSFDDWVAGNNLSSRNSKPAYGDYTAGGYGTYAEANYRVISLRDPNYNWYQGQQSHFDGRLQAGQIIFGRTTDRMVFPYDPSIPIIDPSLQGYEFFRNEPLNLRMNTHEVLNYRYHGGDALQIVNPGHSPDQIWVMRPQHMPLEEFERQQPQLSNLVSQIITAGGTQRGEFREVVFMDGSRSVGKLPLQQGPMNPMGKALHADEMQSDFLKQFRRQRLDWELKRKMGEVPDVSFEQGTYDLYKKELVQDLITARQQNLFPHYAISDQAVAKLEPLILGLPENVKDLNPAQRQFLEAAGEGPGGAKIYLKAIFHEKNAEINLMKRLLFLAASEGKDWFSWASTKALQSYEGYRPEEPKVTDLFHVGRRGIVDANLNATQVRYHLWKQMQASVDPEQRALLAKVIEDTRAAEQEANQGLGRQRVVSVPNIPQAERGPLLDKLSQELREWVDKQNAGPRRSSIKMELASADEMLYNVPELTHDERKFLKDYIKRWGATQAGIREVEIRGATNPYSEYDVRFRNEMNDWLKKFFPGAKVEQINVHEGVAPAWGVKITPELRKKLIEGGVNLSMLPLLHLLGGPDAQSGVA